MANTIKLRRSATAGAVPTTAQLSLGELAINTTDGKMYLKKDVSGTETIVQIGGSIAIAGSPPADASAGDIYWDEDDGSAYIYYDDGNGAAQWVPLTPLAEAIIPGSEVRKLDDISSGFDGIETVFSLTLNTNAHTPAYQNGVFVSIGGVIQEPETDFTITGDQITFTTAPTSGLSFFAVDIGVVNPIGTPSDATVTPAKLSAGGPSWDASSNLTIDGNVGVGTSSPDQLLHLSNSSGPVIRIENTDTTLTTNDLIGGVEFETQDATSPGVGVTGGIRMYAADTFGGQSYMAFSTTNGSSKDNEVMRINNVGYVGIGTTSPNDNLHISDSGFAGIVLQTARTGASENIGGLLFYDIDANAKGQIRALVGGVLAFDTNGSERARIDSSGRLLVGTSSSSAKTSSVFEGNSTTGTGDARLILALGANSPANDTLLGILRFTDTSHSTGNTSTADISVARDGGTWTSGSSMPGRLVFSTTADGASSPTEAMRITKDQAVCINRTGVVQTGNSLAVAGDGTNTVIGIQLTATSGSINALEFTDGSGLNCGEIVCDTSANTTSYSTISDYRLKENVVPIANATQRLNQLRPYRFNFISAPSTTFDGFLAHEAQEVVPEAVNRIKDQVDENGNPEYQTIDQSKLVPLLTAALQEALAEIESLKARVTALEP